MTAAEMYLVVWQLADNEQSLTETPLDVIVDINDNANGRFIRILQRLSEVTGEEDIVIKSVCKL